MFRCQLTGKCSKPGEKMQRVVVQTRPKTYTERRNIDGEWKMIEVGSGYETVRELCLTEDGMRALKEFQENEK